MNAVGADTVRRFADDPEDTLRHDLGLTVIPVDHLNYSRAEGGFCDGVSYLRDGVILYRRTGNRRENFTLGHELGHWLIDRTDAVYDILAQYDDAARMLETVCDRIARALLLPQERVRTVVGSGPVTAHHVGALHDVSNASRPACAVALAECLPSLGAVAIIDPFTHDVQYASVRPDPNSGWPLVYPWPGHGVPPGHPLRTLDPGGSLRCKTFWTDRWGRRADFYLDAVAERGRTVVVFSETDLWGATRFHADAERAFDLRPQLAVTCCGQEQHVRAWPCPTCRQASCRFCGRCGCDRAADLEVLCAGGCFMKYRPHLLEDGLCEQCR